jgi:hypothetical protein
MKFYQAANSKWILGSLTIPAGTCMLREHDNDKLSITSINGFEYVKQADPTDFENEAGVAYADLAAFKTATDNFFIGSESTALIEAVQSSGGAISDKVQIEFTRPADTTPYSIGDVVSIATGINAPFLNVAKAAGKTVTVTGAYIKIDSANAAGAPFELRLFNEAPVAIADNSAYAFNYANKKAGMIPIVMGTGANANWGQNDYACVKVKPTTRDIYWSLTTKMAHTPASGAKYTIILDVELSN